MSSKSSSVVVPTLLLGSEAGQATAHATVSETPEVYIFTAPETGLIEDIFLETNGVANAGVTSVNLGVYSVEKQTTAKASQLLQEVSAAGAPPINSLLHFGGFSVPVIKGKKYALALESVGGALHFNRAAAGTTVQAGTFAAPTLATFNAGGYGVEKAEGAPKFYATGKLLGAGKSMIFGLNGAKNHSATWVANKVTMNRGGPTEPVANEAGVFNKTPAEVSTAVAEMLALGFTHPSVILNCEVLLSKLNAAEFAKNAVAIIKKVLEDHPTVNIFEIINEPQFKGPKKQSNGADYGNIVKAVIERARTEGIVGAKLLITAIGTYNKVNAEGTANTGFSNVWQGEGWIHDMFVAQPSLKAGGENEITTWVSHNYGRAWEATSELTGGFVAACALRNAAKTAGAGGLNNWYLSEFGFNETGGAEGRFVATEAEQNEAIKEYIETAQLAAESGWLRVLNCYDDGADEKWNINGKTAGATYAAFAALHGVA